MCFILFGGLLNCHILSHACKQWDASVSNGYYPATCVQLWVQNYIHPNKQMVNTTNQVTASKSQRSGRNLVFHLIILRHILTYQRILPKWHGSLNVPIEHHPTIRYMVYNGYYKVMSNIPKMGHLPTPEWILPFSGHQDIQAAMRMRTGVLSWSATCPAFWGPDFPWNMATTCCGWKAGRPEGRYQVP